MNGLVARFQILFFLSGEKQPDSFFLSGEKQPNSVGSALASL